MVMRAAIKCSQQFGDSEGSRDCAYEAGRDSLAGHINGYRSAHLASAAEQRGWPLWRRFRREPGSDRRWGISSGKKPRCCAA